MDKEHVTWLADYLANLENAFMVVSHDYGFLEKISTRICDLDNGKIVKYFGTYSEFLKKKTLLHEDYIRQYSSQKKEIKPVFHFIGLPITTTEHLTVRHLSVGYYYPILNRI